MIAVVILLGICLIAEAYRNVILKTENEFLKDENLRLKNDIDTHLKILNGDSVRAKPKRSGN